MRTILVLGAGQSAPFLIRWLLDAAAEGDWRVVVADRDPEAAAARVGGHLRGEARRLDAADPAARAAAVAGADLVVNLLPPSFQPEVARDCVAAGRHMVSASYAAPEVVALSDEARRRGVVLLTEIGLDPGIDHMSAMALVDRLRAAGGEVVGFESYGSGVPAPDSIANPLGYAITWNPRNVVLAATAGARYLRRGKLKVVPWERVFADTWPVEVEGVGPMEAYPNRDSLAYRRVFGLESAATVLRGTLRHPGFCRVWRQVVRLGLPDDRIPIPDLAERSWAELVEMFLPDGAGTVEQRVAELLGLAEGSPEMEALRWLGLFSGEPVGGAEPAPATAADALVGLLQRKLALPPGGRDLVVLLHDLEVAYEGGARRERVTSTLTVYGEPGGVTAMARTVGLPAAIAAKLILDTERPEHLGCQIPTEPGIYRPILRELEREGVRFVERVLPLDEGR
jgi:saccharopine dehydrogenase-like NADP-dependent oxidoreductase